MNSKKNKISPQSHKPTLLKLQQYIENRKFSDVISIASDKVQKFPNIVGYKKALAFCLGATGDLYGSEKLWLDLINVDPFDEENLINLADIELRLGKIDSSLGLLKLSSEYHPNSIKSWLNMASAYLLKGDYQNALAVSLQAINIDAKNADGFQNFGSSLFNLGMFKEAKHAFETALILNPNMQEAKSSLSMVLAKQNNFKGALEILDELISNSVSQDRIPIEQLKWDAALINLRLGNIEKGFEFYEFGMHPNVRGHLIRRPNRSFMVPRWTPDLTKDKPVLIWREQGIGDEILFLTCLRDFIESGFTPIIETDERLISIYQRSFPNIIIRESKFRIDYPHDSYYNDFGSHIPMGSLLLFFRKKLSDFPNSSGYLLPDKLLIEKWRKRINTVRKKGKKIIGISWRGGISDPLRNFKYTKLIDWSFLLCDPNFEFVSLQYGDCYDELKEVESTLGIKIHTWDDLNLKNDIEDIFSLLNNLDHLVTISSAIWMFAASLGTPTSLLLHTNHWTMFDQVYTPFFPNVKCLVTDNNQAITDLLPQALSNLKDI